jgi:hypothetical protein
MLFSKTIKEQNPLKVDSLIYDKNTKIWSQNTINSLIELLSNDITDFKLDYAYITYENQTLLVYHKNEMFYFELENGSFLKILSLVLARLDCSKTFYTHSVRKNINFMFIT